MDTFDMEHFLIIWIMTTISILTPANGNHSTLTVREGDFATLPCIPSPALQENNTVCWSRGDVTISQGENVTLPEADETGDSARFSLYRLYKSDWFLKIMSIKRSDEGVYRCHIQNETIATVKLDIQYKPYVVGYESEDIYIQACTTARVELWCNITGKPRPSIRWFYQKHKAAPQKYIGLSNEMIFIPYVDATKTGLYSCQVTNKHGTATMYFHVNVIALITSLDPEGEAVEQSTLDEAQTATTADSSAPGTVTLATDVYLAQVTMALLVHSVVTDSMLLIT